MDNIKAFYLPTNPRYFFTCLKAYDSKLVINITDLYHGTKRQIDCPVDKHLGFAAFKESYSFIHLTFNRIIIFANLNEGMRILERVVMSPSTRFYFLKIDPIKFEAKITHSFETEIQNADKIFIDQLNSNRFAIVGRDLVRGNNNRNNDGEANRLFVGHFNENHKITWEHHNPLLIDQKYNCLRLEGHILSGLYLTGGEENVQDINYRMRQTNRLILYMEIDLNEDNGNAVDKFGLNVGKQLFFDLSNFQWVDNVCYLFHKSRIFALNIRNRKISTISMSNFMMMSDKDVHFAKAIDNEHVLNFYNLINPYSQLCRRPLRKPESLLMNVWMSLRKGNNSKIYNHALKVLPLNSKLQPFHFEIDSESGFEGLESE